jgi:hypothetical protein
MRFAFAATCAAALIGAPLVSAAATARMDSDQFLNAVRCAAYESVAGDNADIGSLRMQLNAEARRQRADVAAQARSDVIAITQEAGSADAETLRSQRAAACGAGAGMVADRNVDGEAV